MRAVRTACPPPSPLDASICCICFASISRREGAASVSEMVLDDQNARFGATRHFLGHGAEDDLSERWPAVRSEHDEVDPEDLLHPENLLGGVAVEEMERHTLRALTGQRGETRADLLASRLGARGIDRAAVGKRGPLENVKKVEVCSVVP